MLRRRTPLVEFGIAVESAAENPSLEFGERDPLVGDRVIGTDRGFGESDLLLLPSEIPNGQETVGCELIEQPVAVPFEFKDAAAKLAAARNGCYFAEIDLGIIGTLEVRAAEVGNLPVGKKMGVLRIPFERSDHRRVRRQRKIHGGHPGKWAAVQELGIDPAEQQAAIVAAVQVGVVHAKRSITGSEINRNVLIIPEKLAVAKFEMVDGQSKELLNRRLAADGDSFSLREVGSAVGVESHVHNGLLEDDLVEGQLGTKQRADLEARHNVVCVSEGNISISLAAVDSDAAHLDREAKGDGVDAGNLSAASGDPLDFGNQAASHQ